MKVERREPQGLMVKPSSTDMGGCLDETFPPTQQTPIINTAEKRSGVWRWEVPSIPPEGRSQRQIVQLQMVVSGVVTSHLLTVSRRDWHEANRQQNLDSVSKDER